MSDVVIRCEGLGKRYEIGERERYLTLRDRLTHVLYAPARRLGALLRQPPADAGRIGDRMFWALRDVGFEVRRGEVLGIIGRNGAGKSTLLKILSRITKPTLGRARIRGRVGSLLEVGTGFHPELTGRENIYLNGAILGMRKVEMDRKFDEIVAFAEVELFIDTPVKRYSSGMYMRLAFAVAAHLDPEILLVDEVLAVGDAAFQRKCLGKMRDVAKAGRTILFVSHNIVAVEHLCKSAMLLDGGRLMRHGEAREVVGDYLASSNARGNRGDLRVIQGRRGSGECRFVRVEVLAGDGSESVIRSGGDLLLRMHFECSARVVRPVFSVAIATLTGQRIFAVYTSDLGMEIPDIEGHGCIDLEISRVNLMPGKYLLDFAVGDEIDTQRYDHLIDATEFDIDPSDVYGSGRLASANWTLVFFDCKWHLR
jgi:lipopolysaccharide transport system ATP-binding protein